MRISSSQYFTLNVETMNNQQARCRNCTRRFQLA